MLVLKTLASALRWFYTPASNKRKRQDDDDDDDEGEEFEHRKRLKRVELLIEDVEIDDIFYDSEGEQSPLATPIFPNVPAMMVPSTSSPVASLKASPASSPVASPAAPTPGPSKEVIYISNNEDDGIPKKTVIPPLTKKEGKRVAKTLRLGQKGIVSQYKNVTMEYKDIYRLRPGIWLNDGLINFYMLLLMERADGDESLPKIHYFNTFFCSTFREEGYSKVRRWTKRVDMFAKDLIFIPINRSYHWTLAAIDMREKCIRIYDSMGGNHDNTLDVLLDYLVLEHQERKGEPTNLSYWNLEVPKEIPQQENMSDCGIFACTFANRLARGSAFSFSQDDIALFRCRMILNILNQII